MVVVALGDTTPLSYHLTDRPIAELFAICR